MRLTSIDEMVRFGQGIGGLLRGGECFELVGDVGTGKTTFVKGLGIGLKIYEVVSSPSFTISRVYGARDGLRLDHYDFYRLGEPGIMSYELEESLNDENVVTVIEWGKTVADVLPADRAVITFSYDKDENIRNLSVALPEELKNRLRGTI